VKTLQLNFIKCIIPKSRTFKHFLAFLPDACLATKIPDMSGEKPDVWQPYINGHTRSSSQLQESWWSLFYVIQLQKWHVD